MYKRYNGENLYKTKLSQTMPAIDTAWDPLTEFSFQVEQAPENDANFVFIEFNDPDRRDLIYSHRRDGNTLYYYRKFRDQLGNGSASIQHDDGSVVQINSVAQYFNFILDNIDDFGYVQDYGTNKVNVSWGFAKIKWSWVNVDDTILELPNGLNYIVIDHVNEVFTHTQDTPTDTQTLLCNVQVTGGQVESIVTQRGKFVDLLIDPDVFEFGSDGQLKFIWPVPEISDATFNNKGRVRLGTTTDNAEKTAWPVTVATENLIDEPSVDQSEDAGKVPVLDENGLIKWAFIDVDPVFVWTWVLTDVDDDDVYVCTPPKALSAYHTGMQIIFMPDTVNPPWEIFVDVSGLWAKPIKSKQGHDLAWGVLKAGNPSLFLYNGIEFEIQDTNDTYNFFWTWFMGDITYSSNTTLTADVFAHNITIETWVVVNTWGYRIFATGTLTNLGTIHRNGNNWWNWWDWANSWSTAWAAWAAWAALTNNSVAWSTVWGIGGTWPNSAAAGNPWWWSTNQWDNQVWALWGAWWDWGTWSIGSYAWWAGGAVWTSTLENTRLSTPADIGTFVADWDEKTALYLDYIVWVTTWLLLKSSSSWSWWGSWWHSNASWMWWWGGWWWSAWWVVYIAAGTIDNQWAIQSNGWDGGDGWRWWINWPFPNTWWWGGWWGWWGAWWFICLVYKQYSDTGTTQVSWWIWWAWWVAQSSWWTAWANWGDWWDGKILKVKII